MRALLSLPTFPNGVELRPRGQWRYVTFRVHQCTALGSGRAPSNTRI
eukprot:COSAG02_NODE_63248_length_263_cov_1.439024_1_plen_46_part_01